jgi:hypothetical protein
LPGFQKDEKPGLSPNLKGMIPEEQLDALRGRIRGATRLAEEGQLAAGYDLLLAGLRQAQAARRHGQSWAEELVVRYRGARESYVRAYGVRIEPPAEAASSGGAGDDREILAQLIKHLEGGYLSSGCYFATRAACQRFCDLVNARGQEQFYVRQVAGCYYRICRKPGARR